jgi:hypothetical protein
MMQNSELSQIALDLIHGRIENYKTLCEEHANTIKQYIKEINENYVGYVEEIGIPVKVDNYKEIINPINDERKLVKTKTVTRMAQGFVVWSALHPDIEADALLNSLKSFGRENGIQEIIIGDMTIDPNDDY